LSKPKLTRSCRAKEEEEESFSAKKPQNFTSSKYFVITAFFLLLPTALRPFQFALGFQSLP
jgi:hypothetical protein